MLHKVRLSRTWITPILALLVLVGINLIAAGTSAQSETSESDIPSVGKPLNEGKDVGVFMSNSLREVSVGSVTYSYWYRTSPYAGGTENCTAITNGSYAQLSFSPNSGFTSHLYNVPLSSDTSGEMGFGRTPDIYIKGIAPINGLAIVLSCPVTNNSDVLYINILPAPEPEPSPTATPTPTMTLDIPNGYEPTIPINASKGYRVRLNGLAPNATGSVRVSDPSQSFSLSVTGQTPALGELNVAVTADSTGFAEKIVFLTGAKTTGQNITTEFRFIPPSGPQLTKTATVKVINVKSIWFERDAGEVPIDNNPHVGGGLRIFPEKKTPTDSSAGRRMVTVKARVYPAVAGQKVNFRIYDMDDPEFVSPEDTDGAADVDPNGVQMNDNRGATYFSDSHTSYATSYADATGVASALIRVSMQPGDNFKVAAAAQNAIDTNYTLSATAASVDAYIIDVQMPGGTTTPSKLGLRDRYGVPLTDQATNTAHAAATKLLTTWRRLHLEIDSMGTVTGNFSTASITNTTPFPGGFGTILALNKSFELNRFEGGRVLISVNGVITAYKIASSSGATLMVKGQLTDDLIGSFVTIYDDDDMNGDDGSTLDGDGGEDVPSPNLGRIKDEDHFTNNGLMLAYVRPTYDLTGSQSNLSFHLNAPKADLSASDNTSMEKSSMTRFNNTATRNDPEFWTGYLLGAYQNFWQSDDDPYDVDSYIGITGNFGAIVYLEAVSDATDHKDLPTDHPDYDTFLDWRETPLHEVLHLLWADDGDGGSIDNEHYGLSGLTQNKIRNTLVPYMGSTAPLP